MNYISKFVKGPIPFLLAISLMVKASPLAGCHNDHSADDLIVDLAEYPAIEAVKPAPIDGIYPMGENFPMGLYAVWKGYLKDVGQYGWNISHVYQLPPGTPVEYIEMSKKNGLLTHVRVVYNKPQDKKENSTPVDSAAFADFIVSRNATGNVCWWDMPEEMRYWKPSEYNMLKDYARWTKMADPEKKPVYMYIPGHYAVSAIEHYVDYLDIIPASCYVENTKNPRTYVRYQLENIFTAMKNKQAVEGRDYLNGEKTVVAILELYKNKDNTPVTAEGAHHDFWQALACGAKGIFVYSHAYRKDFPDAWEQLCADAANFTGSEKLDQVVLHGQVDNEISGVVTKGDPYAPEINEVVFPSLNLRAFNVRAPDGKNYKYIIAVNSSPDPITANITNIKNDAGKAVVLFEKRKNDTIKIVKGTFTDVFEGNGVHVYKIPIR